MELPDYIDYEGGSTSVERSDWTVKNLKQWWKEEYWQEHKVGGAIPWTIKEQTLMSKMMVEFGPDDLADMISYWQRNTWSPIKASNLGTFYNERIETYHKMKDTVEDFKWES